MDENLFRTCKQSFTMRPNVLLVTMLLFEREIWNDSLELVKVVKVDGLSPLYPDITCNFNSTICQVTVGGGINNAASSMMALLFNDDFDLKRTYIIVTGVAGGNPEETSLGSIIIADLAVQVDLQHEIDAREIPTGWPHGFIPFATACDGSYHGEIYGTEFYRINPNLRSHAQALLKETILEDSQDVHNYRNKYASFPAVSRSSPTVQSCAVSTSNIWFTGHLLSESISGHVSNITKGDDVRTRACCVICHTSLWKISASFPSTLTHSLSDSYTGNIPKKALSAHRHALVPCHACDLPCLSRGEAVYCATAEEDTALLDAIARGHRSGRSDYFRTLIVRGISAFDRPPPGMTAAENLRADTGAFDLARRNLFLAASPLISDILVRWAEEYDGGISPPEHFKIDILGSELELSTLQQ